PAHWYLAHLKAPRWEVAGASFIGLPGFPTGHNGFAAWGITAGLADNTDLFHEQIGPDGTSVLEGGKSVPCEVVDEEIAIRRCKPVVEQVLITPRGPIVSPALDEISGAMSLRATWLEPKPVVGLLGLHRVRSFVDFRKAVSQWPCGTMNMVYADVNDVVGWQFAGDIPRRRKGYGLYPGDGTDPRDGWHDEPIPFEDFPYLLCCA